MNDDLGHKAAEEILQQKQDNSYSDTPRVLSVPEIANWTYCLACYVRRDHVYDSEMKAWRCEFCGVVHEALTRFRKVVTEVTKVAESYSENNPEEE